MRQAIADKQGYLVEKSIDNDSELTEAFLL